MDSSGTLPRKPGGIVVTPNCLCGDVQLIRECAGKPLTPEALIAVENLLSFLDVVLDVRLIDGKPNWVYLLPRDYYMDVQWDGNIGFCFPMDFDFGVPEAQSAHFAADVASGFLEELCGAIDPTRAAEIRSACGLLLE